MSNKKAKEKKEKTLSPPLKNQNTKKNTLIKK